MESGPDDDNTAKLHRGSLRGLAVSFSGQGLRLIISAGQIVVLSRLLAPELFGIFGMTWAVLALLYNCKDMGLSSAVVQHKTGDAAFLDSAFWLSLLGGLAIAAVVALAGPLMAYVYGQPMVSEVCLKLAPMFAVGGVTSHYQAIMRRRMQYVRLNVVMTIAQVVGTGGAILLAMRGRGIDALVFQTLGQELTCLVLQPLVCPWRPKSFNIRSGLGDLLAFGGNLSVFRLVQNMASAMDHFSLGLFTNPAIVGLYNRAQTLFATPRRQMILPISQVMPTMLARLQNNEKEFARTSANLVSASAYIWYAFLAMLVAVPGPVLNIALGEQWDGAAELLQILAIGELSRLPLMLVNMAETQLGRTKSLRNFGLWSATLMSCGLLLGAWAGGAIGMSIAYAIVQNATLVIRLFQIGRETPLTPSLIWKALRGPLTFASLLAAAFYAGAAALRGMGNLAELGAACGAGTLVCVLFLALSPGARRLLNNLIQDIRGASA